MWSSACYLFTSFRRGITFHHLILSWSFHVFISSCPCRSPFTVPNLLHTYTLTYSLHAFFTYIWELVFVFWLFNCVEHPARIKTFSQTMYLYVRSSIYILHREEILYFIEHWKSASPKNRHLNDNPGYILCGIQLKLDGSVVLMDITQYQKCLMKNYWWCHKVKGHLTKCEIGKNSLKTCVTITS